MKCEKLSLSGLCKIFGTSDFDQAKVLFEQGRIQAAKGRFKGLSRRSKLDPHTRALCSAWYAKCELAHRRIKSTKSIRIALKAYQEASKLEQRSRDPNYHAIAVYCAEQGELYISITGQPKQAAEAFQWAISNEAGHHKNEDRNYVSLSDWCEKTGDCLMKIKAWENAKKFFDDAKQNEKNRGAKFDTDVLNRLDTKIEGCELHL